MPDSPQGASETQRSRWRPRGYLAGLLCGVLAVFAAQFLINRTPVADRLMSPLMLPDTSGSGEAIVALGAGVIGDCVNNANGVRRVLLAARLWKSGRAPLVVFTGGPPGTACPAGEAMAELAKEIGVPESGIKTEVASRNTAENGSLTAPLLRALGVRRVVLVTDRLHMRRAEGVFRHQGFEVERASVPIYEGHDDNMSMLRLGLREMIALLYYRLRGWTGPAVNQ